MPSKSPHLALGVGVSFVRAWTPALQPVWRPALQVAFERARRIYCGGGVGLAGVSGAPGAAGGAGLTRFSVSSTPGKFLNWTLRGHLDLVVAGDRATVVDGHAVEGDVEGELVAIDFAVTDGDGIALWTLHRAGERDAVLLESEGEAQSSGRREFSSPSTTFR